MTNIARIHNSIFNYINDSITDWFAEPYPNLTFHPSFQDYDVIEASLPAMTIDFSRNYHEGFELGSRDTRTTRAFEIDIYTELDTTAWALIDTVEALLKNVTIDLTDYDLATPASIGTIEILNVKTNKIWSAQHSATAKNHFVIRFDAQTIE